MSNKKTVHLFGEDHQDGNFLSLTKKSKAGKQPSPGNVRKEDGVVIECRMVQPSSSELYAGTGSFISITLGIYRAVL